VKTLHELVADKLERDPSLLRIPLENIDRWLAQGHSAPNRLEQWRQILQHAQESEAGFRDLLGLLRDPSEGAARLRDFAPFAGTLSQEERRHLEPECAYHF
jgi:hypothetical protein